MAVWRDPAVHGHGPCGRIPRGMAVWREPAVNGHGPCGRIPRGMAVWRGPAGNGHSLCGRIPTCYCLLLPLQLLLPLFFHGTADTASPRLKLLCIIRSCYCF